MPPTPLTATYRIEFRYTVDSFTHKAHMFTKVVASADASGFDTVARAGFTNQGISTVMDNFGVKWPGFYHNANASLDSAVLQHLASGSWLDVYTRILAITGTSANPTQQASGGTWMGKTTTNKKLPFFMYEGIEAGTFKYSSPATMATYRLAMASYLFNTDGLAVDANAWAWRVGRDNTYADHFVSYVVDSNEKLRRIRRLK